jgi:hypothetical protein
VREFSQRSHVQRLRSLHPYVLFHQLQTLNAMWCVSSLAPPHLPSHRVFGFPAGAGRAAEHRQPKGRRVDRPKELPLPEWATLLTVQSTAHARYLCNSRGSNILNTIHSRAQESGSTRAPHLHLPLVAMLYVGPGLGHR